MKEQTKNKFSVGETVLVAYTFGEPNNMGLSRYGETRYGLVTNVEYIEARDSYLYTIELTDETHLGYKDVSIVRSEAWLFKSHELDRCKQFAKSMSWDRREF